MQTTPPATVGTMVQPTMGGMAPGTGATVTTTTGTAPSGTGQGSTLVPSSATGGAGSKGQHSMTGDVVKKDTATGNVRVSTAEGSLTVHFPPQSLASIREGDTITVFMGLSKGTAGGILLSGPTGGIQLQGQHSINGTVSEMDSTTGKVTVTTSGGALDLQFPPQALSDIRQGDTVTLQMAFIPGAVQGQTSGGTQQGGMIGGQW